MSRAAWALSLTLALFAAACADGEGGSGSGSGDEASAVAFAQVNVPVTQAFPGDVIQLDVTGSQSEIDKGFLVAFEEANGTVFMPPFRVANGKAFVMVPGFNATQDTGAALALVDLNGKQLGRLNGYITVKPVRTTPVFGRELMIDSLEKGFLRLMDLSIEAVNDLEAQGLYPQAPVFRDAMIQQRIIMSELAEYGLNLNDAGIAMLEQLLGNLRFLDFIAGAGQVSLGGSASQSSPLHSVLAQIVESALLKADFASLLIGEARGMLKLIAWACTQVSSWPVIGSTAQSVAAWATGLEAQLVAAHNFINQMIPCDLVRITGASSMTFTGSKDVDAKGRFETEEAFNQQLFTTTITNWVTSAATWVTSKMQQSPALSRYSSYVGQVAQLVPGWINSWLQKSGLLQQSVVPGQSFTVLTIDNYKLDMAMYRLDTAGIVANLLNLPRGIVTAFFQWVGIGYGTPVGNFDGVTVTGSVTWSDATDKLSGSTGTGTAKYVAPWCNKAGGWWAQWGFYEIDVTSHTVNVTIN
jgi:hypothetical protein